MEPAAMICPVLLESTAGWWAKHGDGHAMQSDDVLFVCIDINDRLSFRGCRPVVATHIAQHILTRAQQRGLL
jgi:hypothetical protein